MGLIERCRLPGRMRARIALHVLRLRYWWMDTEDGQRARVWAFAGMLLLTIGFNFRERSSGIGVLMIWAGMLLIFGTIIFKILAKLNE